MTAGDIGLPTSVLAQRFPELKAQLASLSETWWYSPKDRPNCTLTRTFQSREKQSDVLVRGFVVTLVVDVDTLRRISALHAITAPDTKPIRPPNPLLLSTPAEAHRSLQALALRPARVCLRGRGPQLLLEALLRGLLRSEAGAHVQLRDSPSPTVIGLCIDPPLLPSAHSFY